MTAPATTPSSRLPLSPTPRSSLGRLPERALLERDALDAVLDSALICHLGVVLDGAPVVLPTGYGRDGDTLYLHGSTGAGSLMAAAVGAPVCLTVTLLDGIVYARCAFRHSMNFRSAVIHGELRRVTDREERMHGLEVLTRHLAPGAWTHVRPPSEKEFAATMVLAMDLTEASVKFRAGDPGDEESDIERGGVWAGVLPIVTTFGDPIPSADLDPMPTPGYVSDRRL